MSNRLERVYLENSDCLICSGSDKRKLGVRGNREYRGADPNATPHLRTNVVRCRTCDFIYTDPEIKGVDFLEAEYYSNVEEYQNENCDELFAMFEHRIGYIKSFSSGIRLLDVGAGKGEFVHVAGENGLDAVGVEPSSNFCAFAKEEFGVEVYNGFLEEVHQLSNQKFDIVTLHHVLEHVSDPKLLLNRVSEFLNEDGIVYIEVPNTDSTLLNLFDLFYRLAGQGWSSRLSPLHPPFHKYGYSQKSLRFLIDGSDFQVIDSTTFSILSRGVKNQSGGFLKRLYHLGVRFLDAFGNRDMLAFVISVRAGAAKTAS